MPKRVNPNLVKIHRSYYVYEAAELLGVHRNTVRSWFKKGLPVCGDERPALILGGELKAFLKGQQQSAKRPCKPDEMYCLKCRAPRQPLGNLVDYVATTSDKGRLIALCSTCESVINRFTTLKELESLPDVFDVSFKGKQEHIINRNYFPLNNDFK